MTTNCQIQTKIKQIEEFIQTEKFSKLPEEKQALIQQTLVSHKESLDFEAYTRVKKKLEQEKLKKVSFEKASNKLLGIKRAGCVSRYLSRVPHGIYVIPNSNVDGIIELKLPSTYKVSLLVDICNALKLPFEAIEVKHGWDGATVSFWFQELLDVTVTREEVELNILAGMK